MTPGRELDALIAEALGWTKRDPEVTPCGYEYNQGELKPFSTDIAAAWELVEKMRADGLRVGVDHAPSDGKAACVVFRLKDTHWFMIAEGFAENAPHAICLTFLKARGITP